MIGAIKGDNKGEKKEEIKREYKEDDLQLYLIKDTLVYYYKQMRCKRRQLCET